MPQRFEAMVYQFVHEYPYANRQEWIDFAIKYGRIVYESGYVRGYEYTERQFTMPKTDPEVIADAIDPTWRDRPYDWKWDVSRPKNNDVVTDEKRSTYDLGRFEKMLVEARKSYDKVIKKRR
jgi:hypothetical protein